MNEADWKQVILFAAGSRQRGFATDIVQRILSAPVDGESTLRSNKIFALQCRAVALDLDPELNAQLQGLEKKLFLHVRWQMLRHLLLQETAF